MKKLMLFIVLLLPWCLWGQNNLIPNSSFRTPQSGQYPECNYCSYYSNGYKDPGINIQHDIQNWTNGSDPCLFTCNYEASSPSWMENSCSDAVISCPSNYFVYLDTPATEPGSGTDALFTGLITNMNGGTTNYLFRITDAIVPFKNSNEGIQSGATRIRVWFSKYGPHWYSTWGNSTLSFAMYPSSYESWTQQWYLVPGASGFISAAFLQSLGNVVITGENGATYVSYVELSQMCQSSLLVQNHTFYNGVNEMPYKASGSLTAGYNVGGSWGYGNVVVQNGGNETFEAGTVVSLKPGFQVQKGGLFSSLIKSSCSDINPNKRFEHKDTTVYEDGDTITFKDDSHDTINCTDTVKIVGLDGDTTSYSAYYWNFGDGTSSTHKSVKKHYSSPGTYLIKLAVTDSLGTDTLTKYYTVRACDEMIKPKNGNNTDLSSINSGEILVYPNPNNGVFNILAKDGASIDRVQVYDVFGRLCYDRLSPMGNTIDMSAYPTGTYFVRVISGSNVYNNRVFFTR